MKLKLFLVFHKNSALILTILMLVLISFSFSNLVEASTNNFNSLNLKNCTIANVKEAIDKANEADNAEELLLDIAAFCSGFKVDGTDSEKRLAELVGQIIRGALTFIGVIFFVLIVFGGFRWMIARGNEEEIKKSRDLIINAAIGLVIIMAAYTLTWFVVEYLATATAIKS